MAGQRQAEEEERYLSSAFCAVLRCQRNRFFFFALLAAGSTFIGIKMRQKSLLLPIPQALVPWYKYLSHTNIL